MPAPTDNPDRLMIRYRSALGNVGSYQASSIPFLSSSIPLEGGGSPTLIGFPKVTKFITVKNTTSAASASAPVRFGFSESGVQAENYIALDNEESFSGDFRVSQVWLQASSGSTQASVAAGMTMIESSELRSNWSGTLGVG